MYYKLNLLIIKSKRLSVSPYFHKLFFHKFFHCIFSINLKYQNTGSYPLSPHSRACINGELSIYPTIL